VHRICCLFWVVVCAVHVQPLLSKVIDRLDYFQIMVGGPTDMDNFPYCKARTLYGE